MKKFKLKANLSDKITIKGLVGGKLVDKPLVSFTEGERVAFLKDLTEETKNKYFIEVKENKDGKAKEQKTKDTANVEQDTKEPSK